MWSFLERLLDLSMFSPHGICLLWEPELIWLHVVSDAIIAIAYFSIPFALAIFVSKRRDVEFGWVLGLCHFHHGVRLDPRFLNLHTLGSDLRHRRAGQGLDRRCLDRNRGDAVAVVAKAAGDSFA